MNRQLRRNLIQAVALALFAFFLASGLSLHAQNATAGAITGTVTDSTGAVVPEAQISATNQATQQVTTATTGDKGSYAIENLPDGDYVLTVTKANFAVTTVSGLHLDPGQRRGQDVKLSIGSVNAKVTVEADAVAVQTESAELGGTITAKEVQNIMLNGRNFQSLLTVVPGVSNVNGANGFYQSGQGAITMETIVNGSSGEETMFTIDGVYNDTSSSDVTMPVTPVVDFVNEMRVLADNYSAKYGLAGRQVLVDTKSGGAKYHGGMYGFARTNEYGTARPYTYTPAQPLASLHLTDWGLTVGGPVKIPGLFNTDGNRKLFFFVGADWKANHAASTLSARNTFTAAMRTGNLSTEPIVAAPSLTPYASLDATHKAILDARMGGGAGSGAACIFQETAGGNYNGILPTCMDPNTVALMNAYWPLPNYSVAGQGNFINTNPVKFSDNEQLYRGDYNLNDKNLITLRILHEEVTQINASRNYNDPAPNPNSVPYTPSGNSLLRWQYTITPNIINTASFGLIYTKYLSQLTGTFTLPSGVKINQAFPTADPLGRIPDISVNNDTHGAENWFWLGEDALPTHSNDATQEISDDFTWVHNSHSFQGGFTYLWNLVHVNASSFPMGNFCINGDFAGDTAANYLLGFLANADNGCGFGYEQTNTQRDGRFHNKWAELYFQDDWRVTQNLTLNLGMRWSYFTAPTKDGNDISNFVASTFASAQAPAVCQLTSGAGCANTNWVSLNGSNQPLTSTGTVANLTNNGMLTAGAGTPAGFTVPFKGLFAPRVGFAYRLTSDGKTSIHGGLGFGYAQVSLLQTSNLLSNIPFVQQPTYNGTEFTSPTGSGATNPPGLTALNATVAGGFAEFRPATVRNYSLTVERQVTQGGVFQIGYAGMTTQHIFTGSWDQNFPLNGTSAGDANCIAQGTLIAQNGGGIVSQPNSGFQFDPCINASTSLTLNGVTVTAVPTNSNYYRPNGGYAGITSGASFGIANYNGLLVGYVQKMHDLTAHVSYTFSKSLGDINASGVQVAYSSSGSFQNANNPLGDYGRPDYDRPHEFVYSLVYDIPAFRNSSSFLERSLLGGWSASSYFLAESGFAQTPSYSTGLASRPNGVGKLVRNHATDGKPGQATVYSYQNFSRPAYGFFGSAGVGSLRAPKEVALHLSVEKGFLITERFNAKIGAQAFNLLNHPNVLGLNTGWSPSSQSTFGFASSYGDPREMQFYARVTF
jgi:hypothetical protein